MRFSTKNLCTKNNVYIDGTLVWELVLAIALQGKSKKWKLVSFQTKNP